MANIISRRGFLKSSLVAGAALSLGFYDSKKIRVSNQFDTIISNGLIYTGDGKAPVKGALGIRNGKIAAIGSIGDSADRIIDAKGNAVSPGFIDIHSHTDGNIFDAPLGDSKIYQGITTDISGNCGDSSFPKGRWNSIEDYYSDLTKQKFGFNIKSYIGQGTLRQVVVGDNNIPATADHMKEMKSILATEMERGALGMTCGLEYVPGSYATSEEIVELLKVVARYDGLFAIHMRNEDDRVEEAVVEAISMAKAAGVRLQISHLKAQNAANWYKAPLLIKQIETAAKEGLDIAFDRYPYIAFSTGLSVFIPLDERQGTTDEIIARLNNEASSKTVEEYALAKIKRLGGAQNVVITSAKLPENKRFIGLNIEECSKLTGLEPWPFMRQLLVQERINVDIIGFAMKEENVKLFLSHPLGMPITDCSVYSPIGKLSEIMPHPRAYGSFPRFLGKYCRDEKLMDLSQGIHKCTALPASRLRLKNRGLLNIGYQADVVVFNPDKIIDRATYAEPHQFAAGIEHILVNGVWTIKNGVATGDMGGEIV
ncbi:MAG: amidohydrolase family protein [Rikenellaceae bacterium]